MKHIVVTDADEGIGIEVVKEILKLHSETYIYFGSQNRELGLASLKELISKQVEQVESRIEFLDLDLTSDDSVKRAGENIRIKMGENPQTLHGLVYNQVNTSENDKDNIYRFHRLTEAFRLLLGDAGTI